ncbi:MAG: hypothetical protein B6D63_00010 [Candidatus Latescibacteria bacterium 4484_7]|nr:MAG: hypothetical protein B6D63_00010 [Candidatus Latescibacteria bacterium 4484_7]
MYSIKIVLITLALVFASSVSIVVNVGASLVPQALLLSSQGVSGALSAGAIEGAHRTRAAVNDGLSGKGKTRPSLSYGDGRAGIHSHFDRPGYYQELSLKRLSSGEMTTVDSLRLLVVRVDFPDRRFDVSRHDSLHYANELRHLYEYFIGASRGRFELSWTIAPGIVHLGNDESYYGNDDEWNERMLEILGAVVDSLDAAIDFSDFDAFAVIHAGAGQETDFNGDSPGQIWSGFLDPNEIKELVADSLGVPGIPTNDIAAQDTFYVDNLIVWPEEASQDNMIFGSLGIFAYQIGLRLGMFSLFDSTPSGFPDSQGIGTFGLMGYGLYNANGFIPANPCAFHRYLMGWVNEVYIDSPSHVRLDDINSVDGDTSLVKVPVSATEYFLLSNRVEDKDFDGRFDFGDVNHNGIPEEEDTLLGAEFDYFLTTPTNPAGKTGSGLFIWHIDEAVIAKSLEEGSNPQNDRARKGVDIEEADGIQDLDRPGGEYAFGSYYDSFRYGNNDRFGVETNPSSANNNGVDTGIEIFNISAPGHTMEFDVDFKRRDAVARRSIAGRAEGFGMICADSDDDMVEELYLVADSAIVCRLNGAGDVDFGNSKIDTVLEVAKGDRLISTPVLEDIDGDGVLEVFDSSKKCILYARRLDGEPFAIDDDETPGELDFHCSITGPPTALNIDSDSSGEILVPCSDSDSTFLVATGSLHEWAAPTARRLSSEAARYYAASGTLVSDAVSVVEFLDRTKYEGVAFITEKNGACQMNFAYLVADEMPLDSLTVRSFELTAGFRPYNTVVLSSGDINGDGSDEIVFSGSNHNLVICDGNGVVSTIRLRGSKSSPAVLSDINGDGVLETLLLTGSYAYLFTGYGVLVDGWPVALPVSGSNMGGRPCSPLAVDVDGDGERDVLFDIDGDLFAYDYNGRQVRGWPLPGEVGNFSSASVLEGTSGSLYLFTLGTEPNVARRFSDSADSIRVSFIRRYELPDAETGDQDWRFFRHDRLGSGRQVASKLSLVTDRKIDEGSFVCYPNPASSGNINVRVLIFSSADIEVTILDVEGEKVFGSGARHVWSSGTAVPFETSIPLQRMSSGVYICTIRVRGEGWSWTGARKFAVVK